jgi:hypothetical protein
MRLFAHRRGALERRTCLLETPMSTFQASFAALVPFTFFVVALLTLLVSALLRIDKGPGA